ncbi:unnamed protein product, partial [marine sediment metagenome]
MKPIKLKALTLASAITIWEIVGRAKVFPPLIFPTVSGAILWGFNNWMRLIDATSYTLKLLTIALSLSTVTC